MKFDSSRTWQEAVAAVKANREVLFAIAGVFMLLPGLASVVLFSDLQARVFAIMGNRKATEAMVQSGELTPLIMFGLVTFVIQLIGYLALLSMMSDRGRPTVGEALRSAVKTLPTVLGAFLLFMAAYLLAMLAFTLVSSLLAASGIAALVVVPVTAFIALLFVALVRLSLTLPVIAIEKVSNPVAALRRSWDLTRDNALRLLLFYVLLFVVYMVIMLLIGAVVGALATLIAGKGMAALLITGLVSGVIGALASVLFTAILATSHQQLAGPSAAGLSATFD